MTNDHDPKNINELDRVHESKGGELETQDDGNVRIIINMDESKLNKPSNDIKINNLLPMTRKSVGNKRSSIMQKSNKKEYMLNGSRKINSVSSSVTRSIGDKIAHDYGGVISLPEIIKYDINTDNNTDIFILAASDGVFTVIDNDDIGILIGKKLDKCMNQKNDTDTQKILEKFVKECNIVWQDEYDDYIGILNIFNIYSIPSNISMYIYTYIMMHF